MGGRRLKRTCEIFAWVGLCVNLAAWAYGAFADDEDAIAVMVTHSPPCVFLVLPVLALLGAAVLRRWRALGASTLALLVGAVPVGGFNFRTSIEGRGPTFSLLAFNVEKWSHRSSTIAEVVLEAGPDVFCLEEAGSYFYVPENERQLREFATRLHGYRLMREGEIMIGTRLPVLETNVVPLPFGPESRPGLELVVKSSSGVAVAVIALHLVYTGFYPATPSGIVQAARERRLQAEAVVRRAAVHEGPVVLCGDFNASFRSATLRRLRETFRDAWMERGFGFGWTMTATVPSRRIDYVLARELDVQSVRVLPVIASDHRALLAVLAP